MAVSDDVRAFTVEQVAAMLNVPRSSIYDWVRRGDIAAVKYGIGQRRRIRIESGAVEEFLARSRGNTGSGADDRG